MGDFAYDDYNSFRRFMNYDKEDIDDGDDPNPYGVDEYGEPYTLEDVMNTKADEDYLAFKEGESR